MMHMVKVLRLNVGSVIGSLITGGAIPDMLVLVAKKRTKNVPNVPKQLKIWKN